MGQGKEASSQIKQFEQLNDLLEVMYKDLLKNQLKYEKNLNKMSKKEKKEMKARLKQDAKNYKLTLKQMKKVYTENKKHMTKADKQAYKLIYTQRKKDFKKLLNLAEDTFEDMGDALEEEFDDAMEANQDKWDKFAEGLSNLAITMSVTDELTDALDEETKSLNELKNSIVKNTSITQAELNDLINNDFKKTLDEFDGLFNMEDALDVVNELGKLGINNPEKMAEMLPDVLKVQATFDDVSMDQLEKLVRAEDQLGVDLATYANQIKALQNSGLAVNSDDLFDAFNENYDTVYKASKGDPEEFDRRMREILSTTAVVSDSWGNTEGLMEFLNTMKDLDPTQYEDYAQVTTLMGVSPQQLQQLMKSGEIDDAMLAVVKGVQGAYAKGMTPELEQWVTNQFKDVDLDKMKTLDVSTLEQQLALAHESLDLSDTESFLDKELEDTIVSPITRAINKIKNSPAGLWLSQFSSDTGIDMSDLFMGNAILGNPVGKLLSKGGKGLWSGAKWLGNKALGWLGLGGTATGAGKGLLSWGKNKVVQGGKWLGNKALGWLGLGGNTATGTGTTGGSLLSKGKDKVVQGGKWLVNKGKNLFGGGSTPNTQVPTTGGSGTGQATGGFWSKVTGTLGKVGNYFDDLFKSGAVVYDFNKIGQDGAELQKEYFEKHPEKWAKLSPDQQKATQDSWEIMEQPSLAGRVWNWLTGKNDKSVDAQLDAHSEMEDASLSLGDTSSSVYSTMQKDMKNLAKTAKDTSSTYNQSLNSMENQTVSTGNSTSNSSSSSSSSKSTFKWWNPFTWFNGSHKDGLDYVPFDGYIAQLHKGETVLTADEADVWRKAMKSQGKSQLNLSPREEYVGNRLPSLSLDDGAVIDKDNTVATLHEGEAVLTRDQSRSWFADSTEWFSKLSAKFKEQAQEAMTNFWRVQREALAGSGDTGGTDGSGSGNYSDISGAGTTAEAVWRFFTGASYSKHATAGIMGNLQQESTMDPTRKQSGGGPGRGIAQWTVGSGRYNGLVSHAKTKGKDWTDLQSQLEWIDMELNGKDPTTKSKMDKNYGGLAKFKQATDIKWAVEAFEKSFERAGKPNYANRYKYAQQYYDQFSNATFTASNRNSVNRPSLAQYEQGTPWVPNTQVALLHKGEMVVPANENPINKITRSSDSSDASTVAVDNSDIVEVIRWAVHRIESKLDQSKSSETVNNTVYNMNQNPKRASVDGVRNVFKF